MYFRLSLILIFCLVTPILKSQDLLQVYHGRNGESVVYNSNNMVVSKPLIKKTIGEKFSIKVLNPNPLFYKYTIRYEQQKSETDSKEIADFLSTLNTILAARNGVGALAGVLDPTFNSYKIAINTLINDINSAKKILDNSDMPELPEDALNLRRVAGLRKAIDLITAIPTDQYRFNNSSLLSDLNLASNAIAGADDVEKQAFGLLNNSLVQKVNEINKSISGQEIKTIWESEFEVTDTPTKIFLVITKINPDNKTLIRDGGLSEKSIEIATIIPYYKRSTLELIPVGTFQFAKDVREFYVENEIVKTRFKQKTTFNSGTVLNINLVRFGELKEMSFGVGPGYRFSSNSDALENIYFSTLFSYKNFIRIGIGIGFSQFPSEELKDGGKIDQPLPSNITNLNDIIAYQEKLTGFLTLSFTGLNLTKKK